MKWWWRWGEGGRRESGGDHGDIEQRGWVISFQIIKAWIVLSLTCRMVGTTENGGGWGGGCVNTPSWSGIWWCSWWSGSNPLSYGSIFVNTLGMRSWGRWWQLGHKNLPDTDRDFLSTYSIWADVKFTWMSWFIQSRAGFCMLTFGFSWLCKIKVAIVLKDLHQILNAIVEIS